MDAQYELALKEADETKAFHDRMFYLKMRGDYYRYLAEQEVADGAPAEDSSQLKAKKAYEDATACFQNANQEVVVRLVSVLHFCGVCARTLMFFLAHLPLLLCGAIFLFSSPLLLSSVTQPILFLLLFLPQCHRPDPPWPCAQPVGFLLRDSGKEGRCVRHRKAGL